MTFKLTPKNLLKIKDHDDFPKQICYDCLERLNNAYEFCKLVEASERALVALLSVNSGIDAAEKIEFDHDESMELFFEARDAEEAVSESSTAPVEPLEAAGNQNNCPVCRKSFNGPNKFITHLKSKHSVRNDLNVLKPFQCDKCEKCYTTLANLTIHKSSAHLGEWS